VEEEEEEESEGMQVETQNNKSWRRMWGQCEHVRVCCRSSVESLTEKSSCS
jgi:hypothetical protein